MKLTWVLKLSKVQFSVEHCAAHVMMMLQDKVEMAMLYAI